MTATRDLDRLRRERLSKAGSNAVIGALKILGALPPTLAGVCGDTLGLILYALDRRHRRIAFRNMARCFQGERTLTQLKQLNRAVFKNMGRIPLEVGRSLSQSPEQMRHRVVISGYEHLQRARQQGRGVLLLTAHIGNWEMAPAVYPLLGAKGAVVYRPLDQPALDRAFRMIRSRNDTRLIANRRAMREILRALREGRMVGLLLDQNVDWYEGVFARFFGRRACTNKGLALLAMKTRAPVVPVFLLRLPDGFKIDIRPPVPLCDSGDKTRDVDTNTQRYNDAIEAAVRRNPDQWFWVHQRWKTRPYQPWPRQARKRAAVCGGRLRRCCNRQERT